MLIGCVTRERFLSLRQTGDSSSNGCFRRHEDSRRRRTTAGDEPGSPVSLLLTCFRSSGRSETDCCCAGGGRLKGSAAGWLPFGRLASPFQRRPEPFCMASGLNFKSAASIQQGGMIF